MWFDLAYRSSTSRSYGFCERSAVVVDEAARNTVKAVHVNAVDHTQRSRVEEDQRRSYGQHMGDLLEPVADLEGHGGLRKSQKERRSGGLHHDVSAHAFLPPG